MKTIAALLLAASLAAAARAAPAANPFSEQLRKLPDIQRRAVMRRAVLDSGFNCKQVGAVTLQGRYKNLEMWTARCVKMADYAVFLGLDGSVQVRPCADLASLKLPLCRLPE